MAYYQTCEWCGAHLDPQETCECKEDSIEKAPGMAVPLGQTEKYLYGYYNRELEELQLKITKIKIRNLFGIREYDAGSESIELNGKNGTGKTSVIDAIRLALTNKSDRGIIVRDGAMEGEIIVETDEGICINRKIRTNQADYKSVKQNGREVNSPETFLKDIFTTLQLNPVEFMSWDSKKQNAAILDMIEYPWDMNTIKEWFGEIPSWVSYDQNILQVLNDIQSDKGDYFQMRQDINRDIRNKRAFVADIAESIPEKYDAEKWRSENLGSLYREIESIRKDNENIRKAKALVEQRDSKIRKFEAEKEISLAAIEREISSERERLIKDNERLKTQMKSNEEKLASLDERMSDKREVVLQKYAADVSRYESVVGEYRELSMREEKPISDLEERAAYVEKMKSHLNEYDRMVALEDEISELSERSNSLTRKIEKARALPGEILATAKIPIDGLTVVEGVPRIHGLPVSNLSEGEKLDLCIDVAIQKPNGLQIILIDGVERLSSELRTKLYQKCKDKGLQFISTRTTDDDELTVVEL